LRIFVKTSLVIARIFEKSPMTVQQTGCKLPQVCPLSLNGTLDGPRIHGLADGSGGDRPAMAGQRVNLARPRHGRQMISARVVNPSRCRAGQKDKWTMARGFVSSRIDAGNIGPDYSSSSHGDDTLSASVRREPDGVFPDVAEPSG
jgi:hypothetical protein